MNNINLLKNEANNNFNNEKAHYFIGTAIMNKSVKKTLLKLIKNLRKKYQLKDFHTNKGTFVVNHLYLGYYDYDTVKLYMNDIIKYLLKALSEKFSELKCNFTNFYLTSDKSFHNISLQLSDKNQYLENKIIPFLQNEAVKDVTNKRLVFRKSTVNLIYYKNSPIIKSKKFKIDLNLPDNTILIDNLCLIKGTPVKLRSGNPSLHDQMVLEPIDDYKYELKGNLGTNNSTANLLGTKNNNNKTNVNSSNSNNKSVKNSKNNVNSNKSSTENKGFFSNLFTSNTKKSNNTNQVNNNKSNVNSNLKKNSLSNNKKINNLKNNSKKDNSLNNNSSNNKKTNTSKNNLSNKNNNKKVNSPRSFF